MFIKSLKSSLAPCPETWTESNILTPFCFNLFSTCCLLFMFIGVGITLDENTRWSFLPNEKGSSFREILSRTLPGSPWCPVHTIKYFLRALSACLRALCTCFLKLVILTSFSNGHKPALIAAEVYFDRLLPTKTTSLPSCLP